jgi:membrane-bound lytic murein transglycosylase F
MNPIAANPTLLFSSRYRQALLAFMVLLATLLAGCGPGQDSSPGATQAMPATVPGTSQPDWLETGDLSAIAEHGVLRILVHQGQDSHLPRNDYPIGASRKWLQRFAKQQDLAVRFVTVAAYADLIPALLQGRGDVIASNLTALPERKQLVQFTLPLGSTREHLVARAADPLTAESDLSGRTIAVQRGTSFAATALALQQQYQDLSIDYVDAQLGHEELLDKLATGEFDLSIADGNYLTAASYYRKDFRRVLPVSVSRDIAWAVRPNAINLLGELNHFISEEKLAGPNEFLSQADFDAIKERKILRVAMHNTMASYYLWRGELYGFEYELARYFAEQFQLRLQIVVAEDYTRILDLLREGKADIAAAFITPTPWRESINIAFSRPNHYASEILVSRPDSGIEDLDQLGNRAISVRKSSAYWQSLQGLVSKGTILNLQAANEQLDTEQLIDQVATGAIDLTVADSHILNLELTWRDDITGSLSLGDPRPQSWAVRESNPALLQAINQFFTREYRGEFYESVYQKYFKSPRHSARIETSAMPTPEMPGLSPYDEMIRRYADQYQFDWRLLAAQIYQESRFDPTAKSWSGAQGLMQILPQTARAVGMVDIQDTETGLHAGIKYMAWLRQSLGENLAVDDQLWFSLAAYNAGIGHVRDARALARRLGKNPDQWFDHVEQAMLLLGTRKYAKKARHGYVRGIEPVQYVSTIRSRYQAYRELNLDEQRLAQAAE